ncbi:MAG: ATP-binding cassette domain-containing protein, partial [Treponema sp.]|nr:ATP-binding cassette domain-containing protein [Treponema sp.]
EKQDSGEINKNNLQIGMVHQHFMLFPEYTVAENIVMGTEPLKWGIFLDNKKANEISDKIIFKNNFSVKSTDRVKDLTLGEMQQVEICRILHLNSQVIVLDEPTSILTEAESMSLFKTLKLLVKNGKSIILITHKLDEIKKIADRVAVIRKGELVSIKDINIDINEIACMMIGNDKPLTGDYKPEVEFNFNNKKNASESEPVITFDNVTVTRSGQKHPLLDSVSFSVHSGEILGFTGVGGNGLGVIEAVLGGFLHPHLGSILHRKKDISMLSPRSLRKQGLAYVPADRVNVGSAQNATISENIIVNRRHELYDKFIFNKKSADEFNKKLKESYNIEVSDFNKNASTLSGGNLQKLILAREINWFKDYFVFSQPTWGLDIAASKYVMEEIDTLRKKGAAIILISTNLEEVLTLADRVIVMYKGAIIGKYVNNEKPDIKEKIGRNMQGLVI